MSDRRSIALGEVAAYIRGINFKPDDVVPLGTPGSVACMRTKNVQRELDVDDVWGLPEGFVRRDEQFLQVGDILVSSANSWNLVGKCCWIPELPWRASFGGFVSVVRANPQLVEPRYLYRWFGWEQTQATLRSFGRQTTNISNLDVERCLAMRLPLPSLREQRRVVELLDRAESLRAKRVASSEMLRTLPGALFADVFGDETRILSRWTTTKLGDLLEFMTSGSRGWAAYYADEGDLFLRIQNVGRDELLLDDVAFVRAPFTAEAKRTRVRAGDVLLSITADLGRTAVIPDEFGAAFINQHLSILRTTELLPRFLSAYLASPAGQRQIACRNRHGVKAGLNFDDIRSFRVPMPPQELQCEFVKRVQAVEHLRQSALRSKGTLDELSASLQSRVFNDLI